MPTQEYKYLNGRCRHYKLIGKKYLNKTIFDVEIFLIKYFQCVGEGHGTGPNHNVAKQALRDMIFSQGTGGGGEGSTAAPSPAPTAAPTPAPTAAPSPPTSPPNYQWTDKDYLVNPSTGQDTNTQSGQILYFFIV